MIFLNFSQLPESVFRPKIKEKDFSGNQAKFSFDWKVFSVDRKMFFVDQKVFSVDQLF